MCGISWSKESAAFCIRRMSRAGDSLATAAAIPHEPMACGYRCDLPAEAAVQLYTHGHWRVPAALLSEVEHASRFAVGVYGFDMELLQQRGWWRTLKRALWWEREPKDKDALNRCCMRPSINRIWQL